MSGLGGFLVTPDDVARIRAEVASAFTYNDWHSVGTRALALCDALEKAWAESDSRREETNRWAARFGEQQARAERAEADRDRYSAKALRLEEDRNNAWRRQAELATALTRIQALPNNDDDDTNGGYRNGYRMAMRRVRAAIEGDSQ